MVLHIEQQKVLLVLNLVKNSINLLLRKPKYNDPKKLVRDVTAFEWGYKGLVKIDKETDVDYLLRLVTQSYQETL